MLKLFTIFSLFSLFSSAFAYTQDFSQCITEPVLDFKTITLNPSIPIIGQELDIAVTGYSSNYIELPTAKLTVSVSGIKVLIQKYDLCEYIDCPIFANNTFKFSFFQKLPNDIPHDLKVTIQSIFYSITNQIIGCFQFVTTFT